MNPDSQNFDSLRKLLALKRHEVPPPGYFDRLSRDIRARIKVGDAGEELGEERSWMLRLLGMFDIKPVFAGAFGTVVCAFLISGIISSEQTPVMAGSPTPAPATPIGPVDTTLADQSTTSSNSLVGNSLFDQFSAPTRQAAFYLPSGH